MIRRRLRAAFGGPEPAAPAGTLASRTVLTRLCPRGPGRTEEPFFEGNPVHNPRAVLALDAATGAAVRAHEIARQGFRVDEADMAARACDADQHGVAPKNSPGYPGLKSHRGISISRCARGAKRGCARTKGKDTGSARMALGRPAEFTRLKAHSCEDEKAPGTDRGRVCVDGGGSRSPRRAIILAGMAANGERAAEPAPSISAHGLVSTFGTNNWPARAINLADRSMSAAGRCGHFN
jgi:hypothetical protein